MFDQISYEHCSYIIGSEGKMRKTYTCDFCSSYNKKHHLSKNVRRIDVKYDFNGEKVTVPYYVCDDCYNKFLEHIRFYGSNFVINISKN